MDFQIVWTEPALAEFEAAVRFAAANNASWAETLRGELLGTVATLGRFLFLGPVYEYERDQTGRTREVMCRKYSVFYRVDEATARVEVLTIWHSGQREPRLPL